jgi:putative aldouronate transport system permease protein
MIKESAGSRTFDVFNYILLMLLAIATVFPFLDVVQVSLSHPSRVLPIARYNLVEWVRSASFEMYGYVYNMRLIRLGYMNSIIQTILSTLFALAVCSLAAYPLSKKRLKGRGIVTIYIAITMFFSGGMIPSYLLIQSLGLLNSLWALIIPSAFSAWNMIMMRTFFQHIPDEMEEAAQIEGANDLYVLFRVYIPLSKALYATMTLFFVVGFWNSWFSALIYLNNPNLFPLQLILRNILVGNIAETINTQFGGGYFRGHVVISEEVREIFRSTVMVVGILPLVIMYPFVQKHFVKGVMIGSIKG